MAAGDYRSCDVCGGKAFYDANLYYEESKSKEDTGFRIAGKANVWGMKLGYVGDWAVICTDCSPGFRTQIVPIEGGALSVIAARLRHFAKDNRERGWKLIADDLEAAADLIEREAAVPSGWQLVPLEPTPEMLAATSWPGCAGTDYEHMLAAAPKHADTATLTSSERVRMPEPMTPNDINLAAGAELAGLLDHIYEHSTTSEGAMPLAMTFARAIEAEVLRRVREENK